MEEKSKYLVLHPIALDGRAERGEIVELTPSQAANFPGRVELFSQTKKPEAPPAKPLDEMTKPELVEKARDMGLNVTGTKADLAERIRLALHY